LRTNSGSAASRAGGLFRLVAVFRSWSRPCAGAGFPVGRGGLPRRAVEWAGAVRADGEDEVGRDGGAGPLVWSSRRGSRSIEHIGSAHDEPELEALKATARQKIAAGQLELALGVATAGPGGPLPVTSTRTGHLLDALDRGYRVLGLEAAAGGGVPAAGGGKGSSSRRASLARCGCWRRPGSRRRRTRRSSGGCRPTRRKTGGGGCRRRAPRTPGPARPASCSTTCPRCTSRPARATGSASPAIRRSGGWSRRSPSGCSPTGPGSR
jgi:hypothetical protein